MSFDKGEEAMGSELKGNRASCIIGTVKRVAVVARECGRGCEFFPVIGMSHFSGIREIHINDRASSPRHVETRDDLI